MRLLTRTTTSNPQNEKKIPIYADLNTGRLPFYHRLDFSIKKLVPSNHDRDYENHLDLRPENKTQIEHVKQPRIAGKKALMVRKSGGQGLLISRHAKMIINKKKGSFILLNFATEYGHLSEAQLLFPKGKEQRLRK